MLNANHKRKFTYNISCTLDRKIGGILSLYPHNRKLVMCLCDTKNKKMGTKKKEKKKNQIEGADCKHLLSEPGDGGLSKFSLLSGRGNTIL